MSEVKPLLPEVASKFYTETQAHLVKQDEKGRQWSLQFQNTLLYLFHTGAAQQDSTSHEVVQPRTSYLFWLHSQITYMFYFIIPKDAKGQVYIKDFHKDKQLEHSHCQVKI